MKQPVSARKAAIVLAIILLVAMAARIGCIALWYMGPNTYSDDNGYLTSGVVFANTGYVAYGGPNVQTSAICYGMPLMLGALLTIFGATPGGLIASHIVFSFFGLFTILAAYLLATMLSGRCAGLIAAALCAVHPTLIMANAVFLTETPYMCFNLFAIYFLMRWAKEDRFGCFWGGVACMCAAATFKGLALLALLATVPGLVRRRVSVRRWLPKALLAATVFVLCFLPWWVRNMQVTDSFVPFTSNRGDIKLLGSFDGIGCPEGSYEETILALDSEAWEQSYQEDTMRRFDIRGEVGKERLSQWFRQAPVGFLITHLLYKPLKLTLLNWAPLDLLPERLCTAFWWLCLALAGWGLLSQKRRSGVIFDGTVLYLLAATFATAIYAPLSRYGGPHIPIWLVYAGIGCADSLCRTRQKK